MRLKVESLIMRYEREKPFCKKKHVYVCAHVHMCLLCCFLGLAVNWFIRCLSDIPVE